MTEPNSEETNLDSRLKVALHQVQVPGDLLRNLTSTIKMAAEAERESAIVANTTETQAFARNSPHSAASEAVHPTRWSRRRFIQGVATAAGVAGVAFAYRQLTCPLSQSWLVECSLGLQAQARMAGNPWLPVTATLMSTPTLMSLRMQTCDLKWSTYCELEPPFNVQSVTVFSIGQNFYAFELKVPRHVEGLSSQLTTISSHSIAAMAMEDSVLFLAGAADLRRHILSRQSI